MSGFSELDRRTFFISLGGAAAVAAMSSEAKADALEDFLMQQLNDNVAGGRGGSGSAASPGAPSTAGGIRVGPRRTRDQGARA